jgi:hypothetical protein
MGYILNDDHHEIDGATLVKLIQRARDREDKRKGILKGQCVDGGRNRRLNWFERFKRWLV